MSSLYWDDPDPRDADPNAVSLDDAFERDIHGGPPPLVHRDVSSRDGGYHDGPRESLSGADVAGEEDRPLLYRDSAIGGSLNAVGGAEVSGPVGSSAALPPENSREILPLWVIIAYGAPNLASASLFIPVAVHLNKFYTDVAGVPASHLAFAIAISRGFDVIIDPLVGWWSDNHTGPMGRRRPFIAVGAPLVGLVSILLFSPPASLDAAGATAWFVAFFALYLMVPLSLPHHSLGPELTLDYHERSRLFAWSEAFTIAGTMLGSVGPAVFSEWFGGDRLGFRWLGVFNALLLVLLFEGMVMSIRERRDFRTNNPIIPGMRRTMRNSPFRILLSVYVVDSITAYSIATLLPFFVNYVLDPPGGQEYWLSILLVTFFGCRLCSIPFWAWLARSPGWGKKRAWLLGWLLAIPAHAACFLLGRGGQWIYLALLAWMGMCGGAGFLSWAIKADVIDYDEFHTGKRREGQYLAFWEVVPKLIAIPGASVPFAILGAAGYDPKAATQPAAVILTIKMLAVFIPVVCSLFAFLIATRFPISEMAHRELMRGIDSHQEGSPAWDPILAKMIKPREVMSQAQEERLWLLDYFDPADLARVVSTGSAKGFRARIVSYTVASAVAFVVFVTLVSVVAYRDMASLWVVPLILAASVAFTALVFNAVRIQPAATFEADKVPTEFIQRHLDHIKEISKKETF